MIERTGDLFTTDLEVIGHGVNTVGIMGAGVAKIVRDRFPRTYKAYVRDCHSGLLIPGISLPGPKENDKFIMNIASQHLPGSNAKLSWLATAVEYAIDILQKSDRNTMAIPQIGCGIGGLEWEAVKQILVALEKDYDFEFEVWTLG